MGSCALGRGGTHRLAERLLVSSEVLNSRAPLLNPAAGAPHSSVGPQFWLLWLGLTSVTKKQQGTAFYPPLTDQVRVELGIKNHNKNNQVCTFSEQSYFLFLFCCISSLPVSLSSSFLSIPIQLVGGSCFFIYTLFQSPHPPGGLLRLHLL